MIFCALLNTAFAAVNAYFYAESGHWYNLVALVISSIMALVYLVAAAVDA